MTFFIVWFIAIVSGSLLGTIVYRSIKRAVRPRYNASPTIHESNDSPKVGGIYHFYWYAFPDRKPRKNGFYLVGVNDEGDRIVVTAWYNRQHNRFTLENVYCWALLPEAPEAAQ